MPAALRAVVGKREWEVSLGTRDPKEAIERATAALDQIAAWHAVARAKHAGELARLSQRQIDALCAEWLRDAVQAYGDDPRIGGDWSDYLGALADQVPFEDPETNTRGAYEPDEKALSEADRMLHGRGIAAHPATVRLTAIRLFETRCDFGAIMLRRSQGDWSDDAVVAAIPDFQPPAPPGVLATPPSAPEPALQASLPAADLLAAWAAERQPARATLRKYVTSFAQLARVLGFDDVRRIQEDDVVAFKAARLREGRDPGTVADDVLACGAVCKWASKNRLLPSNPFAGLAPQISRRGPSSRDGYANDEAKRILLAARGETGWQRWLPWLLCFTGARISKLVELHRGDVRQDGGVWVLDIRPTAERAGKNDTFQRLIPVHPSLAQEGFLQYVQTLPAAPAGPLFPDLPVAADGTRTGTATVVHRRWLRGKVGIMDPRKAPAHSWRHRMEDELRKVRALPEVVDAITGRHNPRNAGAGYGRGFRGMPDEVLKELSKIPAPL
ncbi:hypothetical protein JMJ55_28810 [Belnapia sp. T6]|uniref:DUF6538 domain-containing protein n=1 Tax=Belnapia mucosa TaxID=2804532 RepID=A0ABS1VCC0_9PROT|nr:hypothetical protein [Belnapia mucosa]